MVSPSQCDVAPLLRMLNRIQCNTRIALFDWDMASRTRGHFHPAAVKKSMGLSVLLASRLVITPGSSSGRTSAAAATTALDATINGPPTSAGGAQVNSTLMCAPVWAPLVRASLGVTLLLTSPPLGGSQGGVVCAISH